MDTLTVLVRDEADPSVVTRPGVKVIRDPASAAARDATWLFVMVAASRLREVAGRVREATRNHHLRALLVRDDVGANWITVSLANADVRSLRNLMVHSGGAVPRRIVNAWRHGAQAKLIADASLAGDRLLVRACDLSAYEVPVAEVPALRKMAAKDRARFEVHVNGSFIHWPGADVHLDLDSLRAAIDPAVRERLRTERLVHDRKFGLGVRAVREQHRLSQAAVEGVSERQIRRIESGEFFPRSETLEKLAAAHGVPLSTYLDEVAVAAREATP